MYIIEENDIQNQDQPVQTMRNKQTFKQER